MSYYVAFKTPPGPRGQPGADTGARLIVRLRGLHGEVTELACHPGYDPDLDSAYRAERAVEVAALYDPRVRAALAAEAIGLCSFRELHPRGTHDLGR